MDASEISTRITHTADDVLAAGPYSQAVDAGYFVLMSGQTPLDAATGELATGDIADQTRQCFSNLFKVLAAARLTPDEVVKVNVYLTDMADFSAMNEVYTQQFSAPYPVRTTLGVAALPLGAKVEIEFMAHRSPV